MKTRKTHSDIEGILEAFYEYHKQLNETVVQNEEEISDFLKNNITKSINEEQKKMLIKISLKELKMNIDKLKTAKAPGMDSIIPESYKILPSKMLALLLQVYNGIWEEKVIPQSWKYALILPIPKEGKDLTECSSYRTISLLNVDYKIVMSTITDRLNKLVVDLIHED